MCLISLSLGNMSASTYSPPLSVIMLRTVVLNSLSANVTNSSNALDASGFALQEGYPPPFV